MIGVGAPPIRVSLLVSVALVVAVLAPRDGTAGSETPFGPSEYTRTIGAPDLFTTTFPVTCGLGREFRLIIDNGPAGRGRVGSGAVTLNGVELVHERDFNQRVARIERPVAVQAENRLAVRLAGAPGATVAVSVVSTPCLEILVREPAPDAAVVAGSLLVRGVVRGATEVGVTVNGTPAVVSGEDFAALVVAAPDTDDLEAVATAADGTIARTQQALRVSPATEELPILRAIPAGGPAPLTVRFMLLAPRGAGQRSLDLDNVTPAIQNPDLDRDRFVYDRPGLYLPSLTTTGPGGTAQTVRTLVEVLDVAVLDARIQARWLRLKEALDRGDVEAAVESIALRSRGQYRQLLTNLTVPLSQVSASFTDLILEKVSGESATYKMLRVDNGLVLSHFIRFIRDRDGIWRLEFF